jgi:hypothetical protein
MHRDETSQRCPSRASVPPGPAPVVPALKRLTQRLAGLIRIRSTAVISGTRHVGPWRGAWPVEPSDPQPAVEGSYAGWLGAPIRPAYEASPPPLEKVRGGWRSGSVTRSASCSRTPSSPPGSTVVRAGDEVLALADNERTPDLTPVFTGRQGPRDVDPIGEIAGSWRPSLARWRTGGRPAVPGRRRTRSDQGPPGLL